jgi:hypothetical protein
MTSSIWAPMSVNRDIDKRCKSCYRACGRVMPVWPHSTTDKVAGVQDDVLFYACEGLNCESGEEADSKP